jgi:hypothetical protein
MYFINSTIFVEDGEGQTVGEVGQMSPQIKHALLLQLEMAL